MIKVSAISEDENLTNLFLISICLRFLCTILSSLEMLGLFVIIFLKKAFLNGININIYDLVKKNDYKKITLPAELQGFE